MSIVILSVVIVGGSMAAMGLAAAAMGRPLGGGCAASIRGCGSSIECEGCPRTRRRHRQAPAEEEQP